MEKDVGETYMHKKKMEFRSSKSITIQDSLKPLYNLDSAIGNSMNAIVLINHLYTNLPKMSYGFSLVTIQLCDLLSNFGLFEAE